MKRIIMLIAGATLFMSASRTKTGYEVGDIVADFRLKNIDNKMVSLADYKNAKGAIVIFDCNTCPYSKTYNERIIALNEKYAPVGFPVITINANDPQLSSGDSFEEMVTRAQKHHYTFPYLVDETQHVARSFGATNTPHVFILKKDGGSFKVVYIGAIDNNARDGNHADKKYVEEAVDALLSGKEVLNTKTKAVGCGIKWKNS